MKSDDYETLPTNNVLTHMTAGAMAGVMEHCVMYPLDSVKTRMQSLAPTAIREGIGGTLIRMIKTEGILRPVRGMSAMVLGAGPSHALYFSSYEYLKDRMIANTTTSRYHTLVHGSAGCIATLLHDGIMTPAEGYSLGNKLGNLARSNKFASVLTGWSTCSQVEGSWISIQKPSMLPNMFPSESPGKVVKQRMQMLHSPYKSVLHCVVKVHSTEGMMAFFRSYTTQLTMNVPYQSIHFMVYEFMQKLTNQEGVYNPPAHMVSGAIAGAFASAVTTPLDVCKTLLNTQQGTAGTTTGMVQAVKTVYRLGGPAAYFRGMQARIMYQMPATAICWSTYEFFKYILGVTRLEEVRLVVPPSTVLAETEPVFRNEQINTITSEKISLKPRELPAMAGTGLYGSLSFNTMHTQDSSFNRRKDAAAILDITHT